MVAYLEKSEGSEGFHQIIDFLTASHIKNALTECPTLYASHIEQFWQTAALSINEDGVRGITDTIDRKVKVFVSEASIRRHLTLEDSEGLKTLPTIEFFEQLALIGNMKRASEEYSGVDIPLFPTMLTAPKSSPSRITSSPFLSPQTHSLTSQPPSTPPSIQPTPVTEEAALMPHESPLQRRFFSEEDPSNQGRSLIEELDLDTGISLVPPHAADQGRFDDTQISDQSEEQLEVFSAATALTDAARRRRSVENVQTYIRRRREVSTGSGGVSTASRLVSTADISTASELDSTAGVKAKDKGKAIMHESEPPKKIKKRVQVQMSVDEELAKKLDKREEVAAKVDQAHDIDWSDPAILRYHTLQNRPFSVAKVRKNMCLHLKNQGGYKMSHFKGMSQMKTIDQYYRKTEQVVKESSRTVGGRRKKSLARKSARETLSKESAKKQKLEDDIEKEELHVYLNITLIEPNEEDEIWGNQQDWNLINWKLHNFCGVYVLLLDTGLVIHMMVENKYPLSQDILSKMLSRKLEVDNQSDMDYELIRSKPSRPATPFPSCIHCGYNDHKSDDYVYYPIGEICGSYDHDTHGHNRIISLKKGIKPRNPQHVTMNCETCGRNIHTTSDHNDIEWFRKREALQAKKAKSFKASKTKSSSALRSKTPTKRSLNSYPLQMEDTSAHDTIPILFNKEGTWHLKHVSKAWYDIFSTYLTEHNFERAMIDNTLFIYKTQTNVILVQIHVDNIILESTSTKVWKLFDKLMTQRYEMRMIGVPTYFLEIRINQSERSISINHEKYVKDLLKKYDINGSSMKTPMVPPNNLGPNLSGKAINETRYRCMIGSLMYLTASRPDIQFSTCLCARYQENPKESHLIAVKRIFRYLKGTPSLGLWYLKYLGFDLKGYSDSDYAGCNMDRKSTFGACQLLGGKLVY
ncbi:retrovirus-related pol polyprotein from transposon TNT 1-94 [Tanacetum coccineum]